MRTRVKICGITRVEDGLAAAHAGADAIGLVFDPRSPRHVTFDQARAIAASLPPYLTVVGLFVNAPAELVREALQRVAIDLLQFHGAETPDQCRQYQRPYIKAIPMRSGVDVGAAEREYADSRGLLLDTYHPEMAGGSGERFDWSRVPGGLTKPVVLAGGLSPQNVRAAIEAIHPYAVDVSSGVEQAKGIKDASRISAFIEAVRTA
jgi:phosphoribosylanthranilate isomerase